MSKTIDEKVVEMKFDNKQFNDGIQNTMSFIDKLKQSLNFNGSAKGLEGINSAAKNVNISGLTDSVESLRVKFSALQVAGVTALANITNSAVNCGKRMLSALTIDPIKTGFQEYETQIGAIQTILANTQKEGTNVARVNAALDELNTYADKTIYNFTEMTRNIGTFTAAGVKLDTSVSAIKGIANLAAVSGSTSQQASTAMYQLSQALAAGKVQLMDWNSVVNAGMGGQVFQDALIRTSENLKTGAKEAIKTAGSFRESLTKSGWLTSEVLTETLNQISGAYSKADLIAQGYTEKQAEEITKLADTAVSAATEVKTFTQLWDTMKEAAQSGWSQTWRMIIGDFEKAKERLTELSNLFGKLIGQKADRRNNLLDKVLTSKWDQLTKKMNDAGVKTETFENKIKELAKNHNVDLDKMIKKEGSFEKALLSAFKSGKLDKSILSDAIKSFVGNITGATKSTKKAADQMEKYGKIVDKVINGDFGNGEERIKKLTKAGYDYATIQNLVNKKLGSNVRHLSSLSKEQVKNADNLSKLSDEQLKNKGYTEKQITALRDLAEAADKSGTEINDLINDFEKPSGAELIWDSFMNLLYSIIKPIQAIGKAWRETFPKNPDAIYAAIEAVNKFTSSINKVMTDGDNLKKLTRTFKGLFAIIDIISTIAGGGLKIAFKILAKTLGLVNFNVLDVTANIGDAIVAFRDWLFENNAIAKAINKVVDSLPKAIKYVKEWFKELLNIPKISKFVDKIKNIDLKEIGKNIIEGLKNGIEDRINKVPEILAELGKKLLDAIKEVLGIHSPSVEFFEIGQNIIQGLINGLMAGINFVIDIIKNLAKWVINAFEDFSFKDIFSSIDDAISGLFDKIKETSDKSGVDNVFSNIYNAVKKGVSKITDFIKGIKWGNLFAVGISVAMIAIIKKMADALEAISKPIEGLGNVLDGASDVLKNAAKGIKKALNAFAFSLKAKAIRNISISLAILVGSLALLTFLDQDKLKNAVGVIATLAIILGVLAFSIDKMSNAAVSLNRNGLKIASLNSTLVSIGLALLAMAAAIKMIGSLDTGQCIQGFIGLAGIIVLLIAIIKNCGVLVNGENLKYINKLGSMMLKLSIAMLLMVAVVKLVSKLSTDEMMKGALFAGAFVLFVKALSVVTSEGNSEVIGRLGKTMLQLSIAMILMIGVVKLVGKLSPDEMKKGALFAAAFVLFVKALSKVTSEAEMVKGLGKTLIAISISMLIMTGIVKLISTMSIGDLVKGIAAIAAFTGIIYGLCKAIKTVGPEAPKIAATLLAMSVAIGIMAGVAVVLSLIDPVDLAKGVAAVSILGLVLKGMIAATKDASQCKGNLMMMAIAIGVMAASVAALSLIDPAKLAVATASLATLMGMFALIEKAGSNIQSSVPSILIMTAAVGLLSGMVYLIAKLPIENSLAASASLSTLLLSMAVSMTILSKIGTVSPMALVSIGLMTLVVGALALIITKLSSINVENTTGVVKALSVLLLAMSGALVILSGIGLLGPAAFIGIAALATFIVGIGGLIAGIGALVTEFPKLEEFINTGIPILEKIGYALGSFFGNIVSGFASGATSSLPTIALSLSTFMVGIQPFVNGAKQIDETALSGISSLVKMIALITAAEFLEKITSFVTGSSSMTTFATQLVSFGDAIIAFSNKVKGNIDESSVLAAANAGKLLAEMADTMPKSGGLAQMFAGTSDISAFGSQLVAFGAAIVSFSKKVAGNVDAEAVNAAATAGKVMSEMQSTISPTGGVIQFFTGTKDLSNFGVQLAVFGECITGFSKKVSGKIDEEAVTSAATAGKIMTEMQSNIVPTGGVVDFFTGTKDLSNFGEQIKAFGAAIVGFSKKVSGNIDAEAVTAASNAGKIMAQVQKLIPKNKWGDGKSSLGSFGKQIKAFGGYLADYSKKVADMNIGAVSSSLTATKSLVSVLKNMSGLSTSGAKAFKTSINTLGKADINGFVKAFNVKTSSFSTSGVNAVNSIVKGMRSKQSSISSAMTSIINSMTKSISSKNSTYEKLGEALMNSFNKGITSLGNKTKSALSSAVSKASSAIRSFYSSFYSNGAYVGQGFVNGIKSKETAAYRAGYNNGKASVKGTHDGAKNGSPSRATRKEGKWVGQGLVNGLNSMRDKVYKTGYGLGNSAIKSISSSISKLSAMVDGGVDVNPTICPVVDLSDVESSANAINNLLNLNPSVGVMSDALSINSMMNRRIQNGANDDVVSAISKLGKDLQNIGGTTYTINGITYDDGSNVSEAIETLIRAARIERRR